MITTAAPPAGIRPDVWARMPHTARQKWLRRSTVRPLARPVQPSRDDVPPQPGGPRLVDREPVQEDIELLVGFYGTVRLVAAATDLPAGSMEKIRQGRWERVKWSTAWRIGQAASQVRRYRAEGIEWRVDPLARTRQLAEAILATLPREDPAVIAERVQILNGHGYGAMTP